MPPPAAMVREPRDGQHQQRLVVVALSVGLALTTTACAWLLLRDRGAWVLMKSGRAYLCVCVCNMMCLRRMRAVQWRRTRPTPIKPIPQPPRTLPDAAPLLKPRRKRGKADTSMPVEGSEVFPPLPPEVLALLQVGGWMI